MFTTATLQQRSRLATIVNLVFGVLMVALLFMPTRWPWITALRCIDAPLLLISSVLAWRLDRKRKQLSATRMVDRPQGSFQGTHPVDELK